MDAERLKGEIRTLNEEERRAIRRTLARRRHRLEVGVRDIALFGLCLVGIGWGIAAAVARKLPPLDATAIWLAICTVLVIWGGLSARRELTKDIDRLERTLNRNEAHEVTVQSSEMVEFEEEEDEGACYAFQLRDDRIVFIVGQAYYPSAKFPNTDFSLVSIYADDGRCVEELIYKRGDKLKPHRTIPARFKSEMLIPDHLEMIRGKLSELEGLLTVAYQNRGSRIVTHA